MKLRTSIARWLRQLANWLDPRVATGELVVSINADTSQFMREIEPVMEKARELNALLGRFGSIHMPTKARRQKKQDAAA